MQKVIFIFLLLIIFTSCQKGMEYQARWTILKVKFRDKDVTEYLSTRNITIRFDEGGVVPSLNYSIFKDEDFWYVSNTEFWFEEREGKDIVLMQGSLFFTGEFEAKCVNEDCCNVILENSDKYVELMFSSERGAKARRDCPNTKEFLDEYFNSNKTDI